MKRLPSMVFAVLVAAAGWFVWQQLQNGGWKGLSLPFGPLVPVTSTHTPPPRGNDTIRIATFNIQVFGEAKLHDSEAMRSVVAVLKNFDLIAIQEIRSVTQDIMPQLVAMLNADKQYHYDYAIGPRLGRTNSKEQY